MPSTRPRRRALGALATAIGAVALLAPGSALAATTPISQGHLDWGVKESFRTYIQGGIAHGSITVRDGATRNPDGTFRFPVASGSYATEGGETALQLDGEVYFTGHDGQLDLYLTDPRLEITPAEQTIYAHVRSRQLSDGHLVDYGEIPVAVLDVEGLTPTVTADATAWDAISSAITAQAQPAFGGSYVAGTPMDPVSVDYTGPGGAPDLSEDWAPAGLPVYAQVATPYEARFAQTDELFVDERNDVVHAVTRSGRLLALDPETLAVRAETSLGWSSGDGAQVFDPQTGTFLLGRSGNQGTYEVRYADGAYTAPELVTTEFTVGGITLWDTQRDVLYRMDKNGAYGPLVRIEIADDGSVTRTNLIEPDTLPYLIYTYNAELDARGNILIGSTWGPDANYKPMYVDVSTQPATVSFLPIPATAGASWSALGKVDGDTFLLSGGGSPGPWYLRWADGGWTASEPAGSAYGASPGNGVVLDAHGTIVHRVFRGVALTFPDGREQFLVTTPSLSGNNTVYAGPDGAYTFGRNEGTPDAYTKDQIVRIHRTGVTPSVATELEDQTVTTTATGTTPVTFSLDVAGAPGPTVQWQSAPAGSDRFANVRGETGATLTLEAGVADSGRQFRAILTNAVGTVATEPAQLTVHAPPAILAEPVDVVVAPGGEATFRVMPGGNPAPVIQWQQQVGGDWVDIAADDAAFAVEGGFLVVPSASGPLRLRAKLTSPIGEAYSREATLTFPALGGGGTGGGGGGAAASAAAPTDTPMPSEPGPPVAPAPSAPTNGPAATPVAAITPARGPARPGRSGTATLARLACPAGTTACRISAPRTVTVRIGGRRYTLDVLAPERVSAGRQAPLRVRLPKTARAALRGARATVRVPVAVVVDGRRVTRTVRVTLAG